MSSEAMWLRPYLDPDINDFIKHTNDKPTWLMINGRLRWRTTPLHNTAEDVRKLNREQELMNPW